MLRDCEEAGTEDSPGEASWGHASARPCCPRRWDTLVHRQSSSSVAGALHLGLSNSFHFNFRTFKVRKDATSDYDWLTRKSYQYFTISKSLPHLMKPHSRNSDVFELWVKSKVYYWLILVSDSLFFSYSLTSISSQCLSCQFFQICLVNGSK